MNLDLSMLLKNFNETFGTGFLGKMKLFQQEGGVIFWGRDILAERVPGASFLAVLSSEEALPAV